MSSIIPPPAADNVRATEIFRKAAQLIHEKGYDATTMADIADAVQITKGGLYYYIRGKQELLYSIMRFGMDRLEKEVIEPATAITDPEQRLRTIISLHVELVTVGGEGLVSTVVDEEAGLSPKQRRNIRGRKRAYFDLLRTTLVDLQKEAKLKDVDPTVATFGLFGMILWLPRWFQPGHLSNEQVADEITKMALGGLLK